MRIIQRIKLGGALCMIGVLCAACDKPDEPKKTVENIKFKYESGSLFNGNCYLTNETGFDLEEVNFTFAVVDDHNKAHSEVRYYSVWKQGEVKHIGVPKKKIEKATMSGVCDINKEKGTISLQWTVH